MITSERCEDIGSWLSENAQKETPEYTSTMAVRLYALTHSFSRRFGPRAPLNVAICRAALRWVAIRRDASRSDALCTGLRLRLRMAIRRYVAIRRDMWRCHALCVPYVSSTSLPEDSYATRVTRPRRAHTRQKISKILCDASCSWCAFSRLTARTAHAAHCGVIRRSDSA